MLPQWHVKGLGRSAKSAGGRLHLNTHTPLTQRSRSGLTMPLSRYCVGTYPETSSHPTCQGTFVHSSLGSLSHCGLFLAQCGISVRELISTFFSFFFKAQVGIEWSNTVPKPSRTRRKAPAGKHLVGPVRHLSRENPLRSLECQNPGNNQLTGRVIRLSQFCV